MGLHVEGDVHVPGDKSISHRALMLAAAAQGESRLTNLLTGADCQSTASALRALGCGIPVLPQNGGEIRVQSGGLRNWQAPGFSLDCGNSGTTARLMLGLLAGRPFATTLTGDESLSGRPMRRIIDPLSAMGAHFRELGPPDRLPVEIRGGQLQPYGHRSPKASAQIKSAVLLAGLSGGVLVSVREPIQSRDHTERMLTSLGVQVSSGSEDGVWRVDLEPNSGPLPPLDVDVPGDYSSAAFLIALGLLGRSGELRIRSVGVNPTRTGLQAVISRMGGVVEVAARRESGGEPVADLVVRPAPLHGTEVRANEIPALIDEVPVLAALAARAEGETRITGAAELRVKETDRIAALAGNLRALGVVAEELPDGLVVQGTDAPLSGRIQSMGDHRIAMAFGVLAALPGNRIEIDDPDVVNVSFPGFWTLLKEIAR